MTLLLPAGLLAVALAAPIIVLHMLTPRRPPTPVSSLLHWDGLRHSITAAEPWQKLRWSLLLFLQLLVVLLFAFILARPASVETAQLAEHTVFILDASGSMAAIDGEPDRLGEAVAQAKVLRIEIPDGGIASLVVANDRPTVLLEHSEDADEFERAIDTIRTTGGGANYEAAFALAESLVTADRPTGFVLLSDGRLDDIEQRLAPLGTRFVPIGRTDTNRSITDLSVTAGPGGLQARVTVESTGGPDATQTLRLDVDGVTVLSEQITIRRGEVFEETYELPSGTRVAAFLDGEDLLAYDNQRYVGAPVLGSLKARVYGESTFFVDELLAAIPDVDTDVAIVEDVDFEIFVGVPVPEDQDGPYIAIDVPGGVPGIVPVGRVSTPVPTLLGDHSVFDDIDVSRLAIAEAQLLVVSDGEVLLGAPGAPLIVAGEHDNVPFFYFAFTLEQSNLPIDVSFPIIGARMVGGLAAVDGVAAAITVGETVPLGTTGGTVTDPRGDSILVSVADSGPVADQAGFWIIQRTGEEPFEVAVNPNTAESVLTPVDFLPEIRSAVENEEQALGTATIARTLLPWFVAVLLVLLALELWVSYRSKGVARRQWRWGIATRIAIVALLLLALVNPLFAATSDEVTTVFVVDVSASVGATSQDARAWVESAITDADSAQWAIVEFGRDARVGTPVGTDAYRRARGVDKEATNIARGLRLGGSVLSGETRQRLVLISDGRVNTGDLQAELDRLKTLDIVVDVHTIAGDTRADAAVAGIDVPNSVNEGETFDANVEVLATISATAEVELTDENGILGRRTVQLERGINIVTFSVAATEPGLRRLTASVSMAGDVTAENDSTRNAVEVKGPASVLVVEGSTEGARVLSDALESTGLVIERVDIEELPGIQELSVYQAIIIVDIAARDVGDERTAVLRTYVRDLGRGLVVVGGTHSFGQGSYANTTFEALLPVDSEPPDAEREAEVAEVLLIDTSESMGACHCSPDGETTEEGGVNKTDISKAAALRAIEALGSRDEVGLLAFSGTTRWAIPLQEFPSRETIDQGIGSLRPFGETRIVPALEVAAQALRESDKPLKHIILFTDGFTSELEQGAEFAGTGQSRNLLAAVRALAEEGITVSVVGTGEGATPGLERVAEVGLGRFYPGRDLNEIPEIFVKEARLAARSFINEGAFFPTVTSTSEAVRDLASSPAILGYIGTAAKPTADVQLRVGELADPLLATWRVGLGKTTVWTSDGGERWAADWAVWDGFAHFWSSVARETFALSGSEGQQVSARIADELMTIKLEGAEAWPAGTEVNARISYPDGTSDEIRLERVSDFEYQAVVAARQGGTYAVGVEVDSGDELPLVLSAVATRSFSAEFLPGDPEPDLMASISTSTGGRGEITAAQAFDPEGLLEGVTERTFRWVFLLIAALLWPLDVALRRLRLSRREQPARPEPSSRPQATPTRP